MLLCFSKTSIQIQTKTQKFQTLCCNSKVFFLQIIKDWEVIDDLQVEMHTVGDNPHEMTPPGICEGYLLKGRKWPLKGWHKVRSPRLCPPARPDVDL